MNCFFRINLLFLFLINLSIHKLHSQSLYPSNPDSLGKILCESIDLNYKGLQIVKAKADSGLYAEALSEWRNYRVISLRQNYLGPFGWHGYQINGGSVLPYADYMVGKISQTKFLGSNCPQKNDFINFGFNSAQDSLRQINWLAKNNDGIYPDVYANFSNFIPLASRYYQTGDQLYLQKWFQIASDFACYQKLSINNLNAITRNKINCNWTIDAQAALSQCDRVNSIIRSLGVICKSLPNGGKPDEWDSIYLPLEKPLSEQTVEFISPIELAQIVFSLVFDHPDVLKRRYFVKGAVPNQRRSGLTSLILIATQFPEFKLSKSLLDSTALVLEDYLKESSYKDGGMLEQSFNYNLGDASSYGEIVKYLKNYNLSISKQLLLKQTAYYRLCAALRTPIGDLPAMSSQPSANPPAVWKDSILLSAWMKSNELIIPGKNDKLIASIASKYYPMNKMTDPAFTSIIFPYSGYYVQRKSWNWDSHYLFFQDCRPANGHKNMGHNSIQVNAYGRPLLVSAGQPVYNRSQLKPEFVNDIEAINALLGENSSLKSNTVIVDGHSQIEGDVATTVYKNPIEERWHSSSNFDFMEGLYNLGYPTPNHVNHRREVIFVRDLGCWIITDIMTNLDRAMHKFSQIWNFPGYQDNNRIKTYGFKQNEVVLSKQGINTNDLEGPNIWIYHIGGNVVTDTMYYGQRNPYLGWFAPSFGDIIPAPQIFSTWKSNNHSVLITIIWPTKNNLPPPIKSLINLSDSSTTMASFSMELNDGRRLDYKINYDYIILSNRFKRFYAQGLLTFYSINKNEAIGLTIGEHNAHNGVFEYNFKEGRLINVTSNPLWSTELIKNIEN